MVDCKLLLFEGGETWYVDGENLVDGGENYDLEMERYFLAL